MTRWMSMLGMCARAGKLITGEKACVEAVRGGGVFAVVLDGEAAGNTTKAVTNACSTHGVPLIVARDERLGAAIGKPGRMAAGITDARMAERVVELSQISGVQ